MVYPSVRAPPGLSDWHLILHCKSKRVTNWFSVDRMPVSSSLVSILSEASNHLSMAIQHLDEVGGILRKLFDPEVSPILEAQRSYAKMLTSPMATGVEILFKHYGIDEDARQELACAIRGGIIRFAGNIWWLLESRLKWFPYVLVQLVLPSVSESVKTQIRELLFRLEPCCLDRGFALKARKGS